VTRSFLGVPARPAQQTSIFEPSPLPLPQQQQPQQQSQKPPTQYLEEYPFSPTTPQDLQFLSVANFGGHGYDYDDFSQGFQHLQSIGDDSAQDIGSIEQQRDPLLSMLAEMAERDGFEPGAPAEEGRESDDVWMGSSSNGDGGQELSLTADGMIC
jgi:hypothetical protein